MKTIKELRGYSGCKIILIENNCGCFVRKISKKISYKKDIEIPYHGKIGSEYVWQIIFMAY